MYDEVDPPAHRPNETFYRPRHNYYLAEGVRVKIERKKRRNYRNEYTIN